MDPNSQQCMSLGFISVPVLVSRCIGACLLLVPSSFCFSFVITGNFLCERVVHIWDVRTLVLASCKAVHPSPQYPLNDSTISALLQFRLLVDLGGGLEPCSRLCWSSVLELVSIESDAAIERSSVALCVPSNGALVVPNIDHVYVYCSCFPFTSAQRS